MFLEVAEDQLKVQKPVWKPGVKLYQLSSPNYGIISLYIFACF